MILNVFNQIFTFGIAVLIVFGISYLIDIFIVKINKKAVFVLPAIFFLLGLVFWILGLVSDDWGALGFLLYGSFAAIAFVGSLLAGLLMWFKEK
ncbi:MAG: hypothetical protein CVV57_09985 [Tenericutes bacterium HGW-Tenericutes-2]|jgi:hypothetical protein|nr:MAG: hypothetical protein CVV57_09985 [Tenericutes bacterium HGW-Tenericutes-2]